MSRLSTDFQTLYVGNPHEVAPVEVDSFQLQCQTEDMLRSLFSNGKRIVDCIFDGGDGSLNTAEINQLGDILANLMVCKKDDLAEHIESLQKLFTRPLHAEAKAMAEAYLESQTGED